MTGRRWALPELNEAEVQRLAKDMNVSEAIASVYLVKDLNSFGRIQEFHNPAITDLNDPYLLPDMDIAVERICRALRNNERIFIIGDADCDGISATALAVYAFSALELMFYIEYLTGLQKALEFDHLTLNLQIIVMLL